ncbi:MAG: hypothetical protein NXH85_11285 [Pseudomonadaceae bacterium]|nr:hypothetical protein [Pseudomonadaceae bacterium]
MSGRKVIGVLVAALAMFLVGALYWGVNPAPYESWNAVADDKLAQQQLSQMMPNDGVYFVPGFREESGAALLEDGALFQVYVDHTPVAPSDPAIFAWGFLVNLATAALLVMVLEPGASVGRSMLRGLLLGLLAVVTVDLTNMVWWQVPFSWQLHLSVYTLLLFVIGSAVLAPFLKPK